MARLLALVLAAFAHSSSGSAIDSALHISQASQPTLPFTARINAGKTGRTSQVSHIVEADRARVAHIKSEAARRHAAASAAGSSTSTHAHQDRALYSINATNAVVTYTVNVTVSDGIPRTLLVDTGSSNTWIGYQVPYPPVENCADFFEVQYGSGLVYGSECTDTLTLSPDLVVENQSIGVSEGGYGFDTDGIIGFGPIGLTQGTVIGEDIVPTVLGNLRSQGTIVDESIGIYYAPLTADYVVNGKLTFGGADSSAYVGKLKYTNLTTTYLANLYWGVDQTASYGNSTIMNLTSGIVDTGTTLVYLPSDAFISYMTATGAVFDDEGLGLLTITKKQYAALKPLVFNIGTAGSFALSPNAQIWPRAANADIGGNDTTIYLSIANIGEVSGTGLDFIMGYAFLERFYSFYDTTNGRFGIAPTTHTNATTN